MSSSSDKWLVVEMGMVPYQTAYKLQTRLAEMRTRREFNRNLVLLLEHPPVFTTGKRGGRQNLIVKYAVLAEKGLDIVPIERGGDITYHGPGQLVGYLIVDIDTLGFGIRTFVRSIEEVMCRTAADFGVNAGRNPGCPGAWAGLRKLGSIGIAIRRGITIHGFALNIDMDLTPFEYIHPCGLKGVQMTSVSELKNEPVPMAEVTASVVRHLQAVFNIGTECVSKNEIENLFITDIH